MYFTTYFRRLCFTTVSGGATENAGVENTGASTMKGVEIAGVKNAEPKCAGVKIAEVEIVAPEGRGGKRGRNEYGKPKFPFSDIVVESSIRLVCPSGLQQPIELM